MVVQWLGLSTFAGVAWVQSLGGQLRSCKLSSAVQKQKQQPKKLSQPWGKEVNSVTC